MIVSIAFRNIWRNKLRSLAVISSVAFGIIGGLSIVGMATGLSIMRHESAIKSYVGHIQVVSDSFYTLNNVVYTIPNANQMIDFLEKHPAVGSFTVRCKTEAMIQSANGSSGAILNGVFEDKEQNTFNIAQLINSGTFLEKQGRKTPITIGARLAKKLNISLEGSAQGIFTDNNGDLSQEVFEVVGIYQAHNALYEEFNVYVPIQELQTLLDLDGFHQICVMLKEEKMVSSFASEIKSEFSGIHVDTWKDIAPELALTDKMLDFMLTLFLIIIMAALAFGIVNTMMMAVLERKKELGVLQSIGMNKRKIFWMIILESIFLCGLALPIGILITWLLTSYFGHYGINLEFATEGLKLVGIQSSIYPVIKPIYYIQIAILVCITSILSCINPALRALKMNPIESIRSI